MGMAAEILFAILNIAMSLAIIYVLLFILFPVLFRLNRDTFRRIREQRNSKPDAAPKRDAGSAGTNSLFGGCGLSA